MTASNDALFENETSLGWAVCNAVDAYRTPRNEGDERTMLDFLAEQGIKLVPLNTSNDPLLKRVYVKRWRTLVNLPVKYADEILAALSLPPQPDARDVIEALEPFARLAASVEYTGMRDGEKVHEQYDRDLGKWLMLTREDFMRAASTYAALRAKDTPADLLRAKSDSYGVEGSGFQACMLCTGGGAPGVMLVHDENCPVKKCETIAAEWVDELNADREGAPTPLASVGEREAQWAIFEQAMMMLGDVPGETLLERITKLQGWYMEMQILVGNLKHQNAALSQRDDLTQREGL